MSQQLVRFDELPQNISSQYLADGWKSEDLAIRDVELDLESRTARALVDVDTDFQPNFHFTVLAAYRAVGQLTIGYICTQKGMTKAQLGEVVQTRTTVDTQKPIIQDTGIPIQVTFSRYVERNGKILGEIEFDVADRAFYGVSRFFCEIGKS